MKKQVALDISYHDKQREIFDAPERFKVIAKGRRFGLTRGFANYVIEQMLNDVSPILWVDTIYGNIERYVERYFVPVLKGLPKNYWKYRGNRNELRIGKSVCDFRSADNPENIEGFGYALIVVNEAGIVLKNRSLWNESILPMILDYKANVLIGGTPKGKSVKRTNEKHLFFELFEKGQTSNVKCKTEWKSFNYSSYDNPLLDPNDIDELVKQISPALRDQEIYGKFIDKESSGIIKNTWWKFFENENEIYRQQVFKKVQSWDTAFKKNQENDYSVCITWVYTNAGFYLIDVWRGRVEFPELKRKVVELAKLHSVNEILIEDKASGQSLIQELQRNTILPIKPIKVENDKIARVHSVTPLIEAGKVYLPKDAHWLKGFLDEMEEFPNGEFDDTVDSVSQFLNAMKVTRIPDLKDIVHLERGKIKTKYWKILKFKSKNSKFKKRKIQ
ncbi:MAG: phage terminase large subunit [Ignavibacteriaceae bacterium]|nr:phage terminase large subunit [Ignavibacteriaceae bacterium]